MAADPNDNPLLRLREHGQSVWLDYLRRRFLRCGELERMIREDGLRGETSNPKIFAKAIGGSDDYDDDLEAFAREGAGVAEIYEALAVDDIRTAADLFAPVHEESGGEDGFVSIEVSPHLAHDTEGTIEEARRLAGKIDRPNVMVKIPATPAGLPAIEQMTAEGHSINITLLFSIDDYLEVAEAYLSGLERLVEDGGDPRSVSSVASFFLSRIDVLVDDLLGDRIRDGGAAGERAAELQGEVAIASARLAYQEYKGIFAGERWERLVERGARVQRLLWASTSTKNPTYSDVRYVEALIGPRTVNTLPRSTLAAFRDHGRVAPTLETGLDEARRTLDDLAELGIDLEQVCEQLQAEGVDKFVDPFDELMAAIAARRERILEGGRPVQAVAAGDELHDEVDEVAEALDEKRFVPRMWAKDTSLWSDDPEVRDAVSRRLGWLDVVETLMEGCEPECRFAEGVRDDGIDRVVLLGMGGSSLCPWVCARVFGADEFTVLDSTVPAAVQAVERALDPARTLFVVSSKSGTTTETRVLADRFWRQVVEAVGEEEAGSRFVAVTDPDTPLQQLAAERGFRRTWTNPPDIGGRYSALSYFGLVPMELMGVSSERMLDRAYGMQQASAPEIPAADNPAVRLGIVLARAAAAGRDKVTLLADPRLAPFGDWVEQLLAESTGKRGRGLVPVVGEPLGAPDSYGEDRLFVVLELEGSEAEVWEGVVELVDSLERLGHPVVRLRLDDAYDLGREFLRWEIATAVAGALLGIDPFDEPDVQASKDRTRELLDRFAAEGRLPEPEPLWCDQAGSVEMYVPDGAGEAGGGDAGEARGEDGGGGGAGAESLARDIAGAGDLAEALVAHLGRARPGDYLSIQAFLPPDDATLADFDRLRASVRDRLGIATTFGWGPRYLHSTGQLHKGGPDGGLFLQVTAESDGSRGGGAGADGGAGAAGAAGEGGKDSAADAEGPDGGVDIPGRDYDFGTLARAQALGDLQALADRGRRVLRVHLRDEPGAGVARLADAVAEALPVRAD